MGLDPLCRETARLLDSDEMAKCTLTPLFPDSGVLKMIAFLDDPENNHNNVNLDCAQCHGTIIAAEEDGSITG